MKSNFSQFIRKYIIWMMCFYTTTLVFTNCKGKEEPAWSKISPQMKNLSTLEIEVFHSPTCGCCVKWIEHLKEHGFRVKDVQTEDMETVKQNLGVPQSMASCHTAVIDGYIIEGHVPAQDIAQLLTERPQIKGLSVPQMPVGTPGMESGERKDPFNVFSFIDSENINVYKYYEKY